MILMKTVRKALSFEAALQQKNYISLLFSLFLQTQMDELKSTDPFGSVDLPVGGKSTDPQSGWMDDDGRVLVHHRPSIY